jgi:gliding motility-associated-like protein
MPIFWGDDTGDELERIYFQPIPDVNDMTLNIYTGSHTFPGPGNYKITVEDPNRNSGVINIPNSVDVPMFIESELIINPFIGNNNSVQLLNPPIDLGCVGSMFIHNPAAYDPDGDSLSYKLVNCKGAGGYDIPGYSFPMASESFTINEINGDIVWKNPVIQGEYNIAFIVEEWREGFKVGSVRRDMQIIISSCNHEPPQIITIEDTCILAGDYLVFDVFAWDPDGTTVTLEAIGGPFEQNPNPAFITPDPAISPDTAKTSFNWPTLCSHVRHEPYSAVFKATDSDPDVNLVNFKTTNIKVNAPPPDNLKSEPLGNGINLTWEKSLCENAIGYKIYRRNDASGWEPGYCETGVPPYTGFHLIKDISDLNTLTYRDDDLGLGLVHGLLYCYRITAYFNDAAESYASNETCAALKRDVPIITHVSNDSTELQKGNIELKWAKPVDLDTIEYPGPYKYVVYRQKGITWSNPLLVAEFQGLDDTVYLDQDVNINAQDQPYNYKVDLESTTIGYIGSSRKASSVYLITTPRDKEILLTWTAIVPWKNYKAVVFRKEKDASTFDSIGTTTSLSYRDRGLENDIEYCYYIKMFGEYSIDGIIKPLINFSQISCEIPNDNTPPCQPEISVYTDCEQLSNEIRMWLPYDSCSYDAMRFYIYYTPASSEQTILLDSVDYISGDTSYYLHTDLNNVVGCYYVTATDSIWNISVKSNTLCVDYDACPLYGIPNVFTPNSDNFNDLLVPLDFDIGNPKATIERIDLKIFNRWGKVLFTTEDPQINWDGKNQNNGQDCPEGVYFYTCEVYFVTLDGIKNLSLKGSVTIIRGVK